MERALTAGHRVRAFVRTPSKLTIQDPRLTVMQGDSKDSGSVHRAVADQEAVISLLGPDRQAEPGSLEISAKNIVTAMQEHGIYRLVSTSGAGVWQPQDQPKFVDYFMAVLLHLFAKDVEYDAFANVDVIKASKLDWTVVRFPRLTDGPWTGKYRAGYIGKGSSVQLSRADAAEFILKELTEKQWVRKVPLVSY